jgi:hypothetical protein
MVKSFVRAAMCLSMSSTAFNILVILSLRAVLMSFWSLPKRALKLRMTSMLKAVEDMDKHIAALTKLFTISERAGSVVDEDDKVDYGTS